MANTLADITAKVMPKSGGTMTGTIKTSSSTSLIQTSDDSYVGIYGGTAYSKGAYLTLTGKDNGSAGTFGLVARNGDAFTTLQGKPDGSLTWNSKNVVRSVNNTSADANGNVTISVPTGTVSQKLSTTGKAQSASTTQTITGLTAYKPVFIEVKNTGSNCGLARRIKSGVALSEGGALSESRVSVPYYIGPGRTQFFAVIPTGTSVAVELQSDNGTNFSLKAYQ